VEPLLLSGPDEQQAPALRPGPERDDPPASGIALDVLAEDTTQLPTAEKERGGCGAGDDKKRACRAKLMP
jgi:hypothetical protein